MNLHFRFPLLYTFLYLNSDLDLKLFHTKSICVKTNNFGSYKLVLVSFSFHSYIKLLQT